MKGRILIVIIISLLVGLCVGLSGCSKKELGADLKEWEIKPELKLKADKDKILYNEEIDDIRCNENGLECENLGKIKKYLYVSDKKVKDEKLEKDGKSYDVYKRTKNAVIYKVDKPKDLLGATEEEREYFVGKFYTGNPFYEDTTTGDWYQTEAATTTISAYKEQTETASDVILSLLNIFVARAENFDTTPGDGYVYYDVTSAATWNDAVNATNGTTVYNQTNERLQVGCYSSGLRDQINRTFFKIDTSSIGSSATISSASFYGYIYQTGNANNDTHDYINFYASTATNEGSLVLGDYSKVGSTAYSSNLDLTGLSINQYYQFIFNATGLSAISQTGDTKLSSREGHDVDNFQPNGNNFILFYSSDRTGTAQDPYLQVTYSIVTKIPSAKGQLILFGF